MNKNIVSALVLIVLVVLVLLMTKGSTSFRLLFFDVSAAKSLVFLGFTGVGTLIGLLLK